MSTLEQSFRALVFERDRKGSLQAADRTTLSRWFTKTAVLLAQAHDASFGDVTLHPELRRVMPTDLEVFLARRRQPRQPLDFAMALQAGGAVVSAVGLQVEDLIAHVAPRGTLTSRHGTRLWPLRTHTMRWETLPVIGGFAASVAKT